MQPAGSPAFRNCVVRPAEFHQNHLRAAGIERAMLGSLQSEGPPQAIFGYTSAPEVQAEKYSQ
jgi:hypothetical protein